MSNRYLEKLRNGDFLSTSDQIKMIVLLSLPAILSQISSTLMQYIDASMVGSLGANASASIGIVSSTTWLLGGICLASITGFTVQVAHAIGAQKFRKARNIMKEGFLVGIAISLVLSLIGILVSSSLPGWLKANREIWSMASSYFLIYALFLPFQQLNYISTNMLQVSGNMKTPSLLNIVMCFLDVVFNMYFIFYLDLGVVGASLGTGLSQFVISCILCFYLFSKSEMLRWHKEEKLHFHKEELKNALRIGFPVGIDRLIISSSYIAFTRIVSPLGTIAIASNSFAITAESLCYMPGFGVQSAACTIIGQSIGAKRKDTTFGLAVLISILGIGCMALSGVVMYISAPLLMAILTPEPEIIKLGVDILRIEAFAEPMYGASIVILGILQGAGDTLSSSIMNFISVWFVRIPLAYYLSCQFGLQGAWFAMALELNIRGVLFIFRLAHKGWLKKSAIYSANMSVQ